ncbi:uncharacterized protein EI90DRAFT_327657 [Cantharellus anzutake]|uniref:uncharacterized protein n=1 Tax=Cantharellus anzutake TaxID=1750568 RepID=UPI001904F8AC|nr:uncharacterized protein EI90DRAFT_327657 [Cantharellus anzutake]KAF8335408.1 hypothetical protein EI90DRAFT_327657 [Cantharellus anzutake]
MSSRDLPQIIQPTVQPSLGWEFANWSTTKLRPKSLTWPRATRSLNSSVGVAQQDADMERPQCIRCRILPTRSYTDFTGHHEIESPIQLRSADRVGETLPYISFFDSPASSNLCSNHRVGGTPRLPAAGQCPTDVRPQPGQTRPFRGFDPFLPLIQVECWELRCNSSEYHPLRVFSCLHWNPLNHQ